MTSNPLIFVAQNSDLPDSMKEKEDCLKALKSAVSNVFTDYEMNPDGFRVYDGNLYSQIQLNCPDCGNRIRPINVELGPENGADGEIRCECGFTGRAVYRLIDIERNTARNTVEEVFTTGSMAANDGTAVDITPYETTEVHYPE